MWLFVAVCAGANLVTILTVVMAWRSRQRRRRLAIRTALATVATLFASGFGYLAAMTDAFRSTADADPSEKAALLARGISEAMNCAAFGVLSAALPTIATIWLIATWAPDEASAAGR